MNLLASLKLKACTIAGAPTKVTQLPSPLNHPQANNMQTRHSLFLIGFMGSGKSYWGKIIASRLVLPFLDLDEWIMEKQEKTIAQIFDEQGETGFRLIERDALRLLADLPVQVIATGGGTPCFFDNMDWMNQHGTTIFLNTPPTLLAERLRGEKEFRPLLRSVQDVDLLDFIIKKLEERAEFYLQANIILEQIVGDEEFLEKLVARVQGRVTSP